MKTGTVNLPLHGGKCPPWLFKKMRELAKAITQIIITEYSQTEILKRISDPYWFQALSCVLGYDWHSSGTTTVTCGALKEAIKPEEFGIAVCGGKGKTSRKTLTEIEKISDIFGLSTCKIDELKYASRLSAKVDNSCVQDGYQLYHHCFIFTENGEWTVVQQGMNLNYARRYHWLSDTVKTFVSEPHTCILCDKIEEKVLNLTAKESEETRKTSVDLIKDNPEHLQKYFNLQCQNQKLLTEFTMPKHHPVLQIDLSKQGMKVLQKVYEIQPKDYEELVAFRGIGPKNLRALALISDLIYGTNPSWKDPVKYSFAHGGKDGHPYPVNQKVYDTSIQALKQAIENAKIGNKEKLSAIKRLNEFGC
ncbi:MAG: DUF763 domain-containing protein [Methanosarcinales archaeon]